MEGGRPGGSRGGVILFFSHIVRTERELTEKHRHKERSKNEMRESRRTEDVEARRICHTSFPDWQSGNKSFNTPG